MRTMHKFAVVAVLATVGWGQNAFVQLIHNVADVVGVGFPVVLDSVDIYLSTDNGATWTLAVPDFKFRQATPYTPVPANSSTVQAGIAPGNSTGPSGILLTYTLPSFAPNSYNVAVVAGTIDFLTSSVNVDLYYYLNARGTALNPNEFEFVAFHGAPDVGTVDIYVSGSSPAYQPTLNLAQYAFSSGYLGRSDGGPIALDTTPANRNDILPIGFELPNPTPSLLGQTGVAFASGYVNTPDPDKAFGLYVALANGAVVPLTATEIRRLQILHNAADPALAQVDIHVGAVGPDPIQLDFRQATPTFFVEGPTGASVPLLFTPRGQTSPVLATVTVNIPSASQNHIAIAQGVANPSSFAANPNNVSTAFGIHFISNIEGWATASNFRFVPFHGVTDAPAVDLYAGSTPLATNLQYLQSGTGVTLPAGTAAQVEVRPTGQPTPVATFQLASTQSIGGQGTVIFASGFLNPAANQNGPAFGLFIVYPDGSVEPLALSTGLVAGALSSSLSIQNNPSLDGHWRLQVGAAREGELPYRLMASTGSLISQGIWTVPGAGTWVYEIDRGDLPRGVYLLQVGEKVLRLVRL